MGRAAKWTFVVSIAVALAGPGAIGSARAQEPEARPSDRTDVGESDDPAPRGPGDRRPVPDYDGLPEPGPAPEEVALWVPRALLSPLWFVTDIVIRQPLGALLTFAERERWPHAIVSFLTWDDRRAGIVPTPFFDFGMLPSFGLYFFWNDVGAPGHQLRANLATGGADLLRGTFLDRVLLARGVELSFRIDALRRPDRPFQGIGPTTIEASRVRYRQDSLDGTIDLAMRPWRRSLVRVTTGVRAIALDPDGYRFDGEEPSLATAVATGSMNELPPGFAGFLGYRQRAEAALDTRDASPSGGHALRVDVVGEQGFAFGDPLGRSWVRYGGGVAGFLDAGAERVFSLHLRAAFADPMGTEPVPLSELISLGNTVLDMPSYLPGQIVDRSSVVATVRYRWPIWVWLDASLFVATGNVFGEHLQGFEPDRLRLAWGLYFQSLGDRDAGFRAGLGFGTRAFEQGGDVEALRLVVGGTLGF